MITIISVYLIGLHLYGYITYLTTNRIINYIDAQIQIKERHTEENIKVIVFSGNIVMVHNAVLKKEASRYVA